MRIGVNKFTIKPAFNGLTTGDPTAAVNKMNATNLRWTVNWSEAYLVSTVAAIMTADQVSIRCHPNFRVEGKAAREKGEPGRRNCIQTSTS